jgi:hypothetical protein
MTVTLSVSAEDKAGQGKDRPLDYRKLVDGLVSPNKPIECDTKKSTFSIDPRYDWKAQERVEANRQVLFEHCQEALPQLIDGCTDTRYSLTVPAAEEGAYSWSVGDICADIIARHVEVFRSEIRFEDASHWNRYEFVPHCFGESDGHVNDESKRKFREWWQQHKDMSIRDLQIAAFKWAIEKRHEELKETLNDTTADNADDRKEAVNELANLNSALDKLKRSDSSLPPRGLADAVLSRDQLEALFR